VKIKIRSYVETSFDLSEGFEGTLEEKIDQAMVMHFAEVEETAAYEYTTETLIEGH